MDGRPPREAPSTGRSDGGPPRTDVDDLIARARTALDLVHDDPAAAEAAAADVLARSTQTETKTETETEAEAVQLATWARGKARHELGRFDEAVVDLRHASEVATGRGDVVGAARIDANRALTEHASGDVEAARASLDRAEAHLVGGDAGHLHLQRAIIEVHSGELLQSRASFDEALPLLAASGDRAAVLRCLTSRGVTCTYLGDLAAATDDLVEAIDLGLELGQRLVAAGAMHNLGYAKARGGDAREALDLFARAEEMYGSVGSPERVLAALEQDRAEVLLDAGLLPEAVRAARAAVARHLADGADTAAHDCQLILADALLASGATDEAEATATDLAARLTDAGHDALAARASTVAVRARLDRDPTASDVLAQAATARRSLLAAGWRAEADRLVLDVCAGQTTGRSDPNDPSTSSTSSTSTGATGATGAEGRTPSPEWIEALGPVAAARTSGPATARLRGWHAEALRRHAAQDRRGAMSAVRSGLRVADEHRRALAGDEVRAGAAHRSSALAGLGVRLAANGGRPAAVLEWSEQARARSLLDALPQPGDAELAALLVELRQARAEAHADQGSVTARRRVTSLEAAIRDLEHRRRGTGAAGREPIGAAALRERLGGARLVSFVELDGTLLALVATSRRVRALDLGRLDPIRATLDRLRLATTRLVRGGTGPGVRTALAGFEGDRAQLARQLGTDALGDGPVVVVPSGALTGVPWGALPPLVGRPVTVAPSATHWSQEPDPPADGRPLLVAGPGLPHALEEVATAATDEAEVLTGDDATVAAVVEGFGTRRLLHVAAHGEFRADAPLFGGVDLADGRMTLLDLRTATGHPDVVVLPACHLAATRPLPGGESLGAVAALLGLGVGTVVAPLHAVADEAAAAVMGSFHHHLTEVAPPAALGIAIGELVGSGEPAAATAAAFTCAGRG